MTQTKGRFGNIVLCDDVRVESNGKLILIGVYTGQIVFESFPAFLPVSLFGEYYAAKAGFYTIDLQIFLDRERVSTATTAADVSVLTDPFVFVVQRLPLHSDRPKKLEIEAIVNGGKSQPILEKYLMQGAAPS